MVRPVKKSPTTLTKHKKAAQAYLKYSGMGIQMAVIITIFSFAGLKADAYFQTTPVFTVVCSLSAVVLAIYIFIRQLLLEQHNNQNTPEDEI